MCAFRWFFLHTYVTMHGSENVKFFVVACLTSLVSWLKSLASSVSDRFFLLPENRNVTCRLRFDVCCLRVRMVIFSTEMRSCKRATPLFYWKLLQIWTKLRHLFPFNSLKFKIDHYYPQQLNSEQLRQTIYFQIYIKNTLSN